MIEFRCNGCGREYKVPENTAGKKGKCPNCNTVINVPFQSENKLIFDEIELTCEEPQLQKLYDTIVQKIGDKILKHTIQERQRLIFEIATNEYGTRTQIVAIGTVDIDTEAISEKMLFIFSKVGTIFNPEGAILALRLANTYPFAHVALDEEDVLSVRLFTDLNKSPEVLWPHILAIAIAADKLEELIFAWDQN